MKRLFVFVIFLACSAAAAATEIQFLPEYQATEPIVRLGQIARVYSLDAQETARLNQLELFPAPGNGQQRTVRVADIQEVLRLRSIDVAQIRFSGAASIRLIGGSPVARSSDGVPALSPAAVDQRRRRVSQALQEYMSRVATDRTWEAEVDLSATEAEQIPAFGELLMVASEAELVEGVNRFWVFWREQDTNETNRAQISVYLRPATMVVVPIRPIRRGEVLQAADLERISAENQTVTGETFARFEDVVGQQTTRSLAANRAIQRHDLQRPILVNRRDVVSVLARTGGLEVRTTAQAIDEGAHGDVITVESLTSHKRYLARVVDTQTVELFAGAVTAGGVRP